MPPPFFGNSYGVMVRISVMEPEKELRFQAQAGGLRWVGLKEELQDASVPKPIGNSGLMRPVDSLQGSEAKLVVVTCGMGSVVLGRRAWGLTCLAVNGLQSAKGSQNERLQGVQAEGKASRLQPYCATTVFWLLQVGRIFVPCKYFQVAWILPARHVAWIPRGFSRKARQH